MVDADDEGRRDIPEQRKERVRDGLQEPVSVLRDMQVWLKENHRKFPNGAVASYGLGDLATMELDAYPLLGNQMRLLGEQQGLLSISPRSMDVLAMALRDIGEGRHLSCQRPERR